MSWSYKFAIAWLGSLLITGSLWILSYGSPELKDRIALAVAIVVTCAALTRIVDRIVCGD